MGNVMVDRDRFYERINSINFDSTYTNHNGDAVVGVRMKNPVEIKEYIKKMFDDCIVTNNGTIIANAKYHY